MHSYTLNQVFTQLSYSSKIFLNYDLNLWIQNLLLFIINLKIIIIDTDFQYKYVYTINIQLKVLVTELAAFITFLSS